MCFYISKHFKRTNSASKAWLQAVQPADASHEYAAFFNEKVAAYEQGVWTTGQVQCQHQGILPSMTRMVPADSIPPNKSQSFSIVWVDDTDNICDLSCFLTYLDNFVSKRHTSAQHDPRRPEESFVGFVMVCQPPLSHNLLF